MTKTVSSVNTMSSEKRRYELKARAEGRRQTRERIVHGNDGSPPGGRPGADDDRRGRAPCRVQRLTVYNHFPDEGELFGACQAHWLSLHPLPDFGPAMALSDPGQRLEAVLRRQYAWYRETAPMAENVQRDRGAVPAARRASASDRRRRADPADRGPCRRLELPGPGRGTAEGADQRGPRFLDLASAGSPRAGCGLRRGADGEGGGLRRRLIAVGAPP